MVNACKIIRELLGSHGAIIRQTATNVEKGLSVRPATIEAYAADLGLTVGVVRYLRNTSEETVKKAVVGLITTLAEGASNEHNMGH